MSVPLPVDHAFVGGFRTVRATSSDLAARMVTDCVVARENDASLPKLVFSSNGQGIALAGRDSAFDAIMQSADIIHADGMPVVLASKLTRTPLPGRIATTDFFHEAAREASANGLKFFFLGSTESQNAAAVEAIKLMYPELQIVGRHHGYFSDSEDDRICELVRASGADVLWVALGKPRQEHWSFRNRDNLVGVGWVKTCGGLYAFLAGDVGRAPRWMQRVGLEWAYRMLEDPRRLAWRYLVTNPYAAIRLLTRTRYFPPVGAPPQSIGSRPDE